MQYFHSLLSLLLSLKILCSFFLLSRITHPKPQSIREQVIQKHANRRHHLERHLSELQSTISEHTSGRKLLSDEEYNRHLKFVKGLHRKLAALEDKDPRIEALEIEEEIDLQERMMGGEFLWDMERGELVLKDDLE